MPEILHTVFDISSTGAALTMPAGAYALKWGRSFGGVLVAPGEPVGDGELLFSFAAEPMPRGFGAPLLAETADAPEAQILLRLDTVRFPPGAVAYRHTHAGAGTRVLVAGELTLISDHDTQIATPGTAWFEHALSPVRAEATQHHRETRFIRAMVLPTQFEGEATINILDPADAAQPRLQKTQRYVDQIVQWPPG